MTKRSPPKSQGPRLRPPASAKRRSSISAHTTALAEHEKKIADHTAIQTVTAIISGVLTLVTTVALIAIAYQQYKVSDRQVSLEYAKSSPQFYASVEYRSGLDEYGYAPSAVYVPIGLRLQLVRGDVKITGVSVYQEISIRRTDGFTASEGETCSVTFNDWFSMTPEKLEATANPQVNTLFPQLKFTAADGKPAFMSAGKTKLIVKYEDVFGKKHVDMVVADRVGASTTRDVEEYSVDQTAYLSKSNNQPFSLYRMSRGCERVLSKRND